MATHSSILAWRIPWTEEPSGLQFTGSWRVRHNCACTNAVISKEEVKSKNPQGLLTLKGNRPHSVILTTHSALTLQGSLRWEIAFEWGGPHAPTFGETTRDNGSHWLLLWTSLWPKTFLKNGKKGKKKWPYMSRWAVKILGSASWQGSGLYTGQDITCSSYFEWPDRRKYRQAAGNSNLADRRQPASPCRTNEERGHIDPL